MLSLKEEYEKSLKIEKEKMGNELRVINSRQESYPEENRSVEDLKKDIYNYIIGREAVSFVELNNNIRGFIGNRAFTWPHENIYI